MHAILIKECAMCGEVFETKYSNKEICSFDCKMARGRENALLASREKRARAKRETPPCVACGHWLSEIHHEGYGNTYRLCPNCHSAITRGYYRLEHVLKGNAKFNPF